MSARLYPLRRMTRADFAPTAGATLPQASPTSGCSGLRSSEGGARIDTEHLPRCAADDCAQGRKVCRSGCSGPSASEWRWNDAAVALILVGSVAAWASGALG